MSNLTIKARLTLLGSGTVVLLSAMIGLVFFQSRSILTRQVDTGGLEVVRSNAREVDEYFHKLGIVALGMRDVAAELLETGKAVTDDDLESPMARFYRSCAKESWNMPTQRSVEQGLFEVKERTINNPDGSIRITRTPKVTGKGQQYFVQRFLAPAGVTPIPAPGIAACRS